MKSLRSVWMLGDLVAFHHPRAGSTLLPLVLALVAGGMLTGCPDGDGATDAGATTSDAGEGTGDAGQRDGGANDSGAAEFGPACSLGITVTSTLDPAAANTVRVRIDGAIAETWRGGGDNAGMEGADAVFMSNDETQTLTLSFGTIAPAQCRADPATFDSGDPGITFSIARDAETLTVADPLCRIVLVGASEPGAQGDVLRGHSSTCAMVSSGGTMHTVTFTFDVELGDDICSPLSQAPPTTLPVAAADTVVVGRPGAEDLVLPLTTVTLGNNLDDPHPLHAFFDNGTQQVQLDLRDLDPGVCPWRVADNGIVPYGHHNTVRFIDDFAPYSGTDDLDCQMVIDNGQDDLAAFSGYTTTCALTNDALPGQKVTLALRFALDLAEAMP